MPKRLCKYDHHSSVGSRLAARQAGNQDAMTAIRRKRTAIVAKVEGSVALTPTSIVFILRVRAKAVTKPAAIPATVSRSACPTMVAPSRICITVVLYERYRCTVERKAKGSTCDEH
jgi:hypothetical protein